MRALNSKESVILISNLSSADSLIPQNEIITDITQMRTVANLHESLVRDTVDYDISKAVQLLVAEYSQLLSKKKKTSKIMIIV